MNIAAYHKYEFAWIEARSILTNSTSITWNHFNVFFLTSCSQLETEPKPSNDCISIEENANILLKLVTYKYIYATALNTVI